jgi:hypothetical protein
MACAEALRRKSCTHTWGERDFTLDRIAAETASIAIPLVSSLTLISISNVTSKNFSTARRSI